MRYLINLLAILFFTTSFSQTITVTSPSGGDTIVGGQIYTVTWTSSNITDSVRLYYKRGGIQYTIETVYNTGSYQWTVPSSIQQSNNGYIRITEDKFNPAFDQNDLPFVILEAPKSLAVTFPNTNSDTIYSGIPNTITWTSTGIISKVHIYQSRNGGLSYSRISPYNGIVNSGSFSWTPPNSYQADQFKIKVEGYGSALSHISDTSYNNAFLKIGKTFDLLTPQPKNLVVGTTENVTWTNTGNIAFVNLEYSTNWGPWKTIVDSLPNVGNYAWTIPQDSGNSVRLRIIEHNNPSVEKQVYGYSMSTLPQVLSLTYPNGGETFTEGDSVNIQWTRSANLNGVGLEVLYSLDSGLTWNFIQDNLLGNNYPWVAPLNVNSNNCLIQVRVYNVVGVFDNSDSTFSINPGPPSVRLTNPNGGEKYLAGTTRYISFLAQGGVDTIAVDYSVDNGATYNLLKDSVNALSFNAPVLLPDTQSDQVKMRIRATGFSNVLDESDGAFSIRKFLLSQPYSNQTLYHGSTNSIRWTKSNSTSANVSLYYSVDKGVSWNLIDNNVPNNGNYSWTVPNVISDSAKVKVVDNTNSSFYDESTNYFKLSPSPIVITSPNGGEYLNNGTFFPITWTTASGSNISYVRIKYSVNGGLSWITISNSYQNSGSYNWRTPSSGAYNNVLIRVENRFSSGVPSDDSDAPFNIGITPPTTINLINPNGGENYYRTQLRNIQWNSLGPIDTVDISFSINNGSSWQSIANAVIDSGNYTWTVPNITSNNCLVRVLKTSNPSIGDTSDAVFNILPIPNLTLISPNGGESFFENQTINISWDTTLIDSNININYSSNGGNSWTSIGIQIPNSGSYSWMIPFGSASTQARIQITGSVLGLLRSDFSDNNFTISPPLGTLTLTAPNGGELWEYQTFHDITWTSTGSVGSVNLSYSLDSGLTWIGIKNNEPNDGIENWNPGFGIKSNVLVKIEESAQPLVYDLSDSVFQIIDKPHSINITSPGPQATQMWTEGETRNITWNSTGIFNLVNIYVSNDDGLTYTLIADSVPNDPRFSSSYTWLVPNGLNAYDCRIKIEELGNPSISHNRKLRISDIRTLTILSPNGGEVFNGFDTISVSWQETGLIHTIQLAYSLDSGVNWNNFHVVQFYDTNTFINFIAPNLTSSKVLVRATESQSGFTSDLSDNTFTINSVQRTINLLPIQDTVSFASSVGIDWTSTGVTNFNVLQSLDSGITWTPAPGGFNGVNHFNWSGPRFNTTGVMLKVEDADSSIYFDDSQLLVVEGYSELEVINPNGGEVIFTDSIVEVKWRHYPGYASTLSTASVYYSIDTGFTWQRIAFNRFLLTDSTVNWFVPSSLSGTSALIKVQGEGIVNRVNYDVSDQFFYIRTAPELQLISPDSNEVIYSDSTALIEWTSNSGVRNVNLYYKQNSSTSWISIDSNVVDTGSYLWNVPMGINSWASVKVEMTDSIQIADSNLHVLIKPKFNYLNMLFPNGGEVFNGASYITSVWDWSGVYQFQWELKLSVDSGQTWFNINDGQRFDGVLDSSRGLLPNVSSNGCLMAITSFPYGDTSDAFFTINFDSTFINITSPNGGESFLGNTINKINWDTTSNSHIDSVFVGVKIGNGISGGLTKVANTGSAPLEIPNFVSTSNARAYVRLEGKSISDESDASFSILTTTNDTMILISPNGGEQLIGGQQVPILWQASSNVDFVDLEFSQDSGMTWSSLVSTIPNCGYYLWTVPNINLLNGMIRISGNTKALLTDLSDGTFGITFSTGIKESFRVDWKVFPNPVKNGAVLNIQGLDLKSEIQLTNIHGQVIAELELLNGRVNIPSSISSGNYLLKIVNSKGVLIEKLIID